MPTAKKKRRDDDKGSLWKELLQKGSRTIKRGYAIEKEIKNQGERGGLSAHYDLGRKRDSYW